MESLVIIFGLSILLESITYGIGCERSIFVFTMRSTLLQGRSYTEFRMELV